jgi:glutaminyl-peptide cyclotransferase
VIAKHSGPVLCVGLLLVLTGPGCRPQSASREIQGRAPEPAQLDGSAALEEVRAFLAVGPRVSGTEGGRRAADYLAARLKAFGVTPSIDRFADQVPAGTQTFYNVTGRVSGSGEGLIVLVSHFDTKAGIAEGFSGANDSGSSTGLLLELAELVARQWHGGPDILLAFVDGEECTVRYGINDGLHGSRRLASQLKQARADVRAVIVLDMIGDRNLDVTIPRNTTSSLVSHVFDVAREQGVRHRFSLLHGEIIDDHVPFLNAGFPAVNLIDFNYGSAPGLNDYWHTPLDTLDKLSPQSLQVVGRVVIGVLRRLAAGVPASVSNHS